MTKPSVGILEVRTLTASMLALDAMEKAANCTVIQSELNDLGGICIKVTGAIADLNAGLAAADALVKSFNGHCLTHILPAPALAAWPVIEGEPEYGPLMESNIVFIPTSRTTSTTSSNKNKEEHMAESSNNQSSRDGAIGFIETQGYTAVIEAIDAACKAADVQVLGREKLGGGFIAVVIQGDVAAVNAAIEAGKAHVGELGTLVAAHVIPRPSKGVHSLLPA